MGRRSSSAPVAHNPAVSAARARLVRFDDNRVGESVSTDVGARPHLIRRQSATPRKPRNEPQSSALHARQRDYHPVRRCEPRVSPRPARLGGAAPKTGDPSRRCCHSNARSCAQPRTNIAFGASKSIRGARATLLLIRRQTCPGAWRLPRRSHSRCRQVHRLAPPLAPNWADSARCMLVRSCSRAHPFRAHHPASPRRATPAGRATRRKGAVSRAATSAGSTSSIGRGASAGPTTASPHTRRVSRRRIRRDAPRRNAPSRGTSRPRRRAAPRAARAQRAHASLHSAA